MKARKLKLKCLLVLFSSLLNSCTADPEQVGLREKLPFDQALLKASPILAQTKARLDFRVELFCGSKSEKGTIRKELKMFRDLCAFYAAIRNAAEPTFVEIRKSGSVPQSLFVFSVFEAASRANGVCDTRILSEAGNCDSYVRLDIGGPFLDMKSCAVVESLAWKYDVSIQRCHEWKEPSAIAEIMENRRLE